MANSSNKTEGEEKFSDNDNAHTIEIRNDLNKVKTKFEELSEVAKECNNFLDSDNQKYDKDVIEKYEELILNKFPHFDRSCQLL